MIAENLLDVFSKSLLGGDGTMVHNSRILEGPRYQEEMATLEGGLSDVSSKDGAKVLYNAVEATAVDQTKSRFQSQLLAAKIGDFKSRRVGVRRRGGGRSQSPLRYSRGQGPQNPGQPATGKSHRFRNPGR